MKGFLKTREGFMPYIKKGDCIRRKKASALIWSTEIHTIQGGSGLGGRGRRRWLDVQRNSPNLHPPSKVLKMKSKLTRWPNI